MPEWLNIDIDPPELSTYLDGSIHSGQVSFT